MTQILILRIVGSRIVKSQASGHAVPDIHTDGPRQVIGVTMLGTSIRQRVFHNTKRFPVGGYKGRACHVLAREVPISHPSEDNGTSTQP